MPAPLLILTPLRDEIQPAITSLPGVDRVRTPAPAVAYRCADRCTLLGWSGIGGEATQEALRVLVAEQRPRALLHMGIAGALQPWAKPGDVYQIEKVHLNGTALEIPGDEELRERLRGHVQLWPGTSVSVKAAANSPDAKRRLAQHYPQAAVVEMETYWAAQAAQELGLPLLCLRVVADTLEQPLPDVLSGLDPVGRPRPLALARQLLRRPWALRSLPAMARSFLRARERLTGIVHTLSC